MPSATVNLLLVGADTVFRDGSLVNKVDTEGCRRRRTRQAPRDRRLRGDEARPGRPARARRGRFDLTPPAIDRYVTEEGVFAPDEIAGCRPHAVPRGGLRAPPAPDAGLAPAVRALQVPQAVAEPANPSLVAGRERGKYARQKRPLCASARQRSKYRGSGPGRDRRRRVALEAEKPKTPASAACRVAHEILVEEHVDALEVRAVGLEDARGNEASARRGGRSGGSGATSQWRARRQPDDGRATTNNASGNSAWRKRVLSRFGGDFSTRSRLERSQCGDQAARSRSLLPSPTSGEASVRCARSSKPNRPGPP